MPINPFLFRGLQSVNKLFRPVDALFAPQDSFTPLPPLFIVGPPRSGTTLIYQLITQYFQVGYMTAPLAYAYGLSNLFCHLSRPLTGRPPAAFESHYGHIPGIFSPSEHANYWFQWFPENGELGHYLDPSELDSNTLTDIQKCLDTLSSLKKKPWVFKNLYLSMSVGALAMALPKARFILVRRDPLLVYQSVLRVREQKSRNDWWSIKPPHYRGWIKLPVWQQVARQVFYAEAIPRRDLLRYAPNRFMEIEYSDICRDPVSNLQCLENWLEPLGYNTYPSKRVLPNFEISNNLHLEPEIVQLVRNEFDMLRNNFNTLSE